MIKKKVKNQNSVSFFSPAKINLFFRVLKKRKDGFHDIASLMQTIDFGDTLFFEPYSCDKLTCNISALACDKTNLIMQGLCLFRQKTGFGLPLKIHIEKRIPMQAGLGGGSSNLATTLWALNELSGHLVSQSTLQMWSSELSSDAPFFFSTGTAYVQGRGEQVTSLPPLSQRSFYLLQPEERLSTSLVYHHCLPASIPPIDMNSLETLIGYNDLEKGAFFLKPELGRLKKTLKKMGFDLVCMTGSGSCFFCFGTTCPSLESLKVTSTPTHFIHRLNGVWYEPKGDK